jgi:hypothetical protein
MTREMTIEYDWAMIRTVIFFVRDHASLTLVVVGSLLSLILPFFVVPAIWAFSGYEAFWISPSVRFAVGLLFEIGTVLLLAGISLGLW